MQDIIDKTMDKQDLELPRAKIIIEELNTLIVELRKKKIKISSWYGVFDLRGRDDSFQMINRGINYQPLKNSVDDINFPWFLYWEIVWIILNNDFKIGQSVLDMGGSSSLFSYYLASKGLNVTTIDFNEKLVDNANYTASTMKWSLQNIVMDMKRLSLDKKFDHITSVSVFEHIAERDRIIINKAINRILKPNGNFSITFDYRNPSSEVQINSPRDIELQFVIPSELYVRGNRLFYDSEENYLLHPFYSEKLNEEYKLKAVRSGMFNVSELGKVKTKNDYTFGSLFMTKKSR